MGTINDLYDLLVEELQHVYDAEHQLIEALPKMEDAALGTPLKYALREHLQESNEHLARVEEAFEELSIRPRRRKSKGMAGLLKEATEMIATHGDSEAIDAGLINAMQKVEHYEIATYGTLKAHALRLDLANVAKLMSRNLREERAADKKLTDIAERFLEETEFRIKPAVKQKDVTEN